MLILLLFFCLSNNGVLLCVELLTSQHFGRIPTVLVFSGGNVCDCCKMLLLLGVTTKGADVDKIDEAS